VADTFNSRIQVFSATGRFLKMWGDVDRPRGISVGPDDNIYVACTSASVIKVFNKDGKRIRSLGRYGSGKGSFKHPIGIVAHTDGNLYVADSKNRRIQVIKPDGRFVKEISVPGWKGDVFVEPYLTVYPNGDIAATDPPAHAIYRFNADGDVIKKLDLRGQFSLPMGIVRTVEGKVFVVDSHGHRVKRVQELEE
jgi:sugar lactone lactonase YvrE